MPRLTIGLGAVLIVIGAISYIATSFASWTALIPAILGVLILMHENISYTEYVQHRGIKETEAESVAYIVAGTLGLDTSAYSVGYVAQWSEANPELIKETAARVLKTAHQIIEAITEEQPTN